MAKLAVGTKVEIFALDSVNTLFSEVVGMELIGTTGTVVDNSEYDSDGFYGVETSVITPTGELFVLGADDDEVREFKEVV